MIDKQYGRFILMCDFCANSEVAVFDEFNDAVEFAEKNGWGRKRKGGEWLNICPECMEGGGSDG